MVPSSWVPTGRHIPFRSAPSTSNPPLPPPRAAAPRRQDAPEVTAEFILDMGTLCRGNKTSFNGQTREGIRRIGTARW